MRFFVCMFIVLFFFVLLLCVSFCSLLLLIVRKKKLNYCDLISSISSKKNTQFFYEIGWCWLVVQGDFMISLTTFALCWVTHNYHVFLVRILYFFSFYDHICLDFFSLLLRNTLHLLILLLNIWLNFDVLLWYKVRLPTTLLHLNCKITLTGVP